MTTDTDTAPVATNMLYRSFAPELEVRSAAQGGDGRTVHGIAVPYGRAQRIDDQLTEQFSSGAFRRQFGAANRIAFARDHIPLGGTLIGRLDVMRDDAAGLYVEARVAKTAAGDETLALLEDGALRDLSIGFRPRQNRRLPDGTIERVTAELREVAVVLEGAYGKGATVGGLRGAGAPSGCTCGDQTCEEVPAANLHELRRLLSHLPPLPAPAS